MRGFSLVLGLGGAAELTQGGATLPSWDLGSLGGEPTAAWSWPGHGVLWNMGRGWGRLSQNLQRPNGWVARDHQRLRRGSKKVLNKRGRRGSCGGPAALGWSGGEMSLDVFFLWFEIVLMMLERLFSPQTPSFGTACSNCFSIALRTRCRLAVALREGTLEPPA